MVNINNANNQGISANYYKDFNVNQENLILNNYKGESVNTNLGGVIYGNPNFNVKDNNGNNVGREADIILNEITTNRVSNINGYIEVAGKKADVIIANPNGLMVGGAGFINTSRLSMITGSSLNSNNGIKSSFDSNGNLNPFLLTDTNQNPNAIIQVVGQNVFDKNGNPVAYNLGIDAKDVKYADLISRVIKLNGNIVGSDNTEVNIKTGNDKAQYNKNTGFAVSSKADNNSEKPEFAIDSTAFGGIYAGRIKFIATEDGVGVRTRSDLIASVDDINFDVNGNIILEEDSNLYAKRNVNLDNTNNSNNKDIINKSTITAETGDININSSNDFINVISTNNANSIVYAKNNINITALNSVRNTNNSYLKSDNNINITATNGSIINNINSVIYANNNINLTAIDNTIINDNNATIYSNNDINIISTNKDITNNNTSTIYANNNINITTTLNGNIVNNKNSIIQSNIGNITLITDKDILNNDNSAIQSSEGSITLNTNNNINNTNNSIIQAILNNMELYANNNISNTDNSQIQAGNNTNIIVKNNLDNSNKGYIYSSNNLYINILNNLNNTNNAIIEGDGNITIISKNIDNTNGTITSTATNTANNTNTNNTRNSATNQQQNLTQSSTTTQIPIITINTTNSINNNNGNIRSNGDITINIDKDYNINGTLYSNSSININAKNITNNSDVISANDIIFNAIGNIINGSKSNLSTIIAMNNLIFNISKDTSTANSANTTGNLYNYGKISANNDLTINAEDSIYNGLTNGSNALISGNNSVNLVANRRLINKGFIQAVGKTDSYGNKIENTGNLNITTNAEINDDYELGGSQLALGSVLSNDTSSQTLPAEVQAKLDNIDNITDFEELNDLLMQIKTEDQYYLVQNRIRVLDIQLMLNDLSEENRNKIMQNKNKLLNYNLE